MPLLPPFIGRRAPILHFLIARLQCVPKPRFLGLIKKAHPASAIERAAYRRVSPDFPSVHPLSPRARARLKA
ncbi:MAG: hypothetical protein DMF76_07595 [Acidobacteria bacterium]|nr:MAG: hypothetical protein DMF76_07595 [Acidobacteriota bacterium]